MRSALRRARAALTVGLVLACAQAGALAGEAAPLADDPVLEARVMRLAEGLRCVVCQNETLADSQAELAVDLRQQIRQRLARGEADTQVVDFLVARYGEFVRYRPAFSPLTALLWAGPFGLLLLAMLAMVRQIRRRAGTPQPRELSEAERGRVQQLLGGAGVNQP